MYNMCPPGEGRGGGVGQHQSITGSDSGENLYFNLIRLNLIRLNSHDHAVILLNKNLFLFLEGSPNCCFFNTLMLCFFNFPSAQMVVPMVDVGGRHGSHQLLNSFESLSLFSGLFGYSGSHVLQTEGLLVRRITQNHT